MMEEHNTIKSLQQAYESQIPGNRLLLPTIQRGLVWDNERIVDYWDTLNRGWFSGIFMMRHLQTGEKAYDVSGDTALEVTVSEGDKEIFDGQQRISAIMLGYGLGRLARSHRLWIGFKQDNGTETPGIRFRITTLGQPFGYRIDKPNEKFEAKARRNKFAKFCESLNKSKADTTALLSQLQVNTVAFNAESSEFLLGDTEYKWLPLASVLRKTIKNDKYDLNAFCSRIESEKVLVRKVTDSEFADYEEFFRRIGQGGVRLTDDELTYALMNKHFPALRPLIEKMVDDKEIGHLASPADIALGLFRLARIEASSVDAFPRLKDWERASRPTPDYVRYSDSSTSANKDLHEAAGLTKNTFDKWISDTAYPSRLLKAVRALLLSQDEEKASPMMLRKVDRYVIDIAMMLCGHDVLKKTNQETLTAFCYWALFFSDTDKVAYQLACALSKSKSEDYKTDGYGKALLKRVVSDVTDMEKAHVIPTSAELDAMRAAVISATSLIPSSKWFSAADKAGVRKPSAFFEHMHFWSPRAKNLLLWAQRSYLNQHYPDFDPTTDRDEDLPIDLDHIVAGARFGFHWSAGAESEWRLKLGSDDQLKMLRDYRKELGNRIGNLRWLDATQNRSRGQGGGHDDIPIDDETIVTNHVDEYRRLVGKLTPDSLTEWSSEDFLLWQRVVILRTIDLVEKSISEWNLADIIN